MSPAPADKIVLAPTIKGANGRAWSVDLDAAYALAGQDRAQGAETACWLVEAHWAHPLWHSYWFRLINLRPVPGVRQPVLYLPGATHELVILALDPAAPRQAMIESGVARALRPVNFAAQITEANDADAVSRVEATVRQVCDGTLSPDTDFMSVWADLFGDNMVLRASAGVW